MVITLTRWRDERQRDVNCEGWEIRMCEKEKGKQTESESHFILISYDFAHQNMHIYTAYVL